MAVFTDDNDNKLQGMHVVVDTALVDDSIIHKRQWPVAWGTEQ